MTIIKKGGAFTNHPGVIDYKGKSYFFYHTGALPGGGGFNRSVAVEEFKYLPDGSIPRITNTVEGVKPVKQLNPYQITQAETIAWQSGVETAQADGTGMYVTEISSGDYIEIRSVDLGKGPKSFQARVAGNRPGAIEVRLDSLQGRLLSKLVVKPGSSAAQWTTQLVKIQQKATGVHDLFLVFKGDTDQLFNFDWWRFNK